MSWTPTARREMQEVFTQMRNALRENGYFIQAGERLSVMEVEVALMLKPELLPRFRAAVMELGREDSRMGG